MPIFDQFEIAINTDYSGSYTDNVVVTFSGTQFQNKKFLGSKTSRVASSSSLAGFETLYSDYIAYVSGNILGKNNKFISLTSDEVL